LADSKNRFASGLSKNDRNKIANRVRRGITLVDGQLFMQLRNQDLNDFELSLDEMKSLEGTFLVICTQIMNVLLGTFFMCVRA
jgi:hypothetical protein